MFDLEEIVPKVPETFGKIRFAGGIKKIEERVRSGRNTEMKHVANIYALYSEKHRKMGVILPLKVKVDVKFKDEVKLINPRLKYETGRTQTYQQGEQSRGFTQAMLYADNIEVVGGGK